jgi:hypothetical protein
VTAETITLRSKEGATTEAQAEVVRYNSGARTGKMIGFIAGGLIGGAACILVPVLHLITTWALPLIGIIAGIRASKTHASITDVVGPCPACQKDTNLLGGKVTDHAPTDQCRSCRALLEMVLQEDGPSTGSPVAESTES